MELIKTGVAGTLESGDIYVEVEKGDGGITVELSSTVKSLYGRQIENVIRETAGALGVGAARIVANDKGALDCTIRARVTTAFARACGSEAYEWTAEGRKTNA